MLRKKFLMHKEQQCLPKVDSFHIHVNNLSKTAVSGFIKIEVVCEGIRR